MGAQLTKFSLHFYGFMVCVQNDNINNLYSQTLVVWGAGERYPSIVPELPPPPTYSPGIIKLFRIISFYVSLH